MNQPYTLPTITILGTGYVGLTTAAIFAAAGMKTFVVDPNDSRLEAVRHGKSFFYEEGLDPLIKHGVDSGLLIPTQSYKQSVPKSDIVISAVGTPDNPDGSSNLTYVFAAAEEAAKYLSATAIYAQKSTVPVGTGKKIKEIFQQSGVKTPYLSNPEFLRESTALFDSLWFDRIVIGGDGAQAIEQLMIAYRIVRQNRSSIAIIAGIQAPEQLPQELYIATSLESAELIKVTSNAFLALKITFANSIAKLSDQAGADINEIMDIMGADHRIGRAFLNAGRGYGGGCFPKDVSGLINSAAEYGVDLPIMHAAQEVNESMVGYVVNKTKNALESSLEGKKIAVLGLAFKSGTSDVRRSPGVALANLLSRNGAQVTVFDPKANGDAKPDLRPDIQISKSTSEALKDTDAVIVATDWPEFLQLDLNELRKHIHGTVFVDATNSYDIQAVQLAGLQYIGVGRGNTT